MNKGEFLERLEKSLKGRVGDVSDILGEYEQHFAQKTADGYSEEEIAAKLEKPEILAEQFAQAESGHRRPSSLIARIGVALLSIFAFAFFACLFASVLVIGAAALVSFVTGACLITTLNPAGLIPPMPYAGSLLMGICAVALAVLLALCTIYFFLYAKQLVKAYSRWARNSIGSSAHPPLPINPQLGLAEWRRFRNVALIALAVFGATFVAGYVVMAASAGSLGFWHVWHWFSPR